MLLFQNIFLHLVYQLATITKIYDDNFTRRWIVASIRVKFHHLKQENDDGPYYIGNFISITDSGLKCRKQNEKIQSIRTKI